MLDWATRICMQGSFSMLDWATKIYLQGSFSMMDWALGSACRDSSMLDLVTRIFALMMFGHFRLKCCQDPESVIIFGLCAKFYAE